MTWWNLLSVLIWKRQAGRQERRDKEERNEGNNAVKKGKIQELRREISRKIYLTFQAYAVLYRIQDFQSGLLLCDSLFRPPPPSYTQHQMDRSDCTM